MHCRSVHARCGTGLLTCGLGLVGDDAAHEVRRRHVEVVHQPVQRLLVRVRDGHVGRALALLLAAALAAVLCIANKHSLLTLLVENGNWQFEMKWTVFVKGSEWPGPWVPPCLSSLTVRLREEERHQLLLGLRQQVGDRLVQRILVLEEPAVDIVHDCASIVVELKVRFIFGRFGDLRFAKVLGFAQVVLVEHGLEGLIRGFGEHALLLHN